MSNINLFTAKSYYVGAWSSGATYKTGEVVKASNKGAYRCIIDGTTGAGHDPISDGTNWSPLIPPTTSTISSSFTVSQLDRNSVTTFGIDAGSTWQHKGNEWALEKSGSSVNLVRMRQNCNCYCDCYCSWIDCDCLSDCDCYSDCYYAYECDCCDSGPWCCMTNCTNCPGNGHYGDCPTCQGNCCEWTDCHCDGWVTHCITNCDCFTDCDCAYQCNCDCTPI